MSLIFNTYSFILLIFGTLTAIISFHIYSRGNSLARLFALIMFFNSIWSIGVCFELASKTVENSFLFVKIEYIGIVGLPVFWLLFALKFNNINDWHYKPKNLLILLFGPIVGLTLVWTNEYHHLYFKNLTFIDKNAEILILNFKPSIGYWFLVVYLYTMIAIGFYLIIRKFKSSQIFTKSQKIIILFFAILPWTGNLFYQLNIKILGDIEITPFLFIITSIVITIGIYQYKLFDILPYARSKALDIIDEGFVMLNYQNQIIDYNNSFFNFLPQLKNQEILKSKFEDIFYKYSALINAIKQRKNLSIELKLIDNQQEKQIQLDIIHFNINNSNEEGKILKFQDITNDKIEEEISKRRTRELNKLNHLKDKIFNIVSNDLKEPVIKISKVLDSFIEKEISYEEFDKLIPVLNKDAINTLEILENLLHWSRSQLKGFGIKKEVFNVRSIIQNEIRYQKPILTLKNIKIFNEVFPQETAYADIIMFQIIIRNIIANAIKFNYNNGKISINAAYQKNKMLLISISDNGIGISNEKIKTIIETSSDDIENHSTGLGLIICREFLEKNDGKIEIESEINKGTTIKIWIPVVEFANETEVIHVQ